MNKVTCWAENGPQITSQPGANHGKGENENDAAKSVLSSSLRLPWPARSLERRRVFQEIFHAFFEQVLDGCDNSACKIATCASCRKRKCKQPFRPYTSSTARAIALHLASEEHPLRRLCPDIRAKRETIAADELYSRPNKSTEHAVSVPPREDTNGNSTPEHLPVEEGSVKPSCKEYIPSEGPSINDAKGARGEANESVNDEVVRVTSVGSTKRDPTTWLTAYNDIASRSKDPRSLVQKLMNTSAFGVLHATRLPQWWIRDDHPEVNQIAPSLDQENSLPSSERTRPTAGKPAKIAMAASQFWLSTSANTVAGQESTTDEAHHSANDLPQSQRRPVSDVSLTAVESTSPPPNSTLSDVKLFNIVQNKCEVLEIHNASDRSFLFAVPKSLIENNTHLRRSDLFLTQVSATPALLCSTPAMPKTLRDMRSVQMSMSRASPFLESLGRSDFQVPLIWHSADQCDVYILHVIKYTKRLSDLLCSARTCLLSFTVPVPSSADGIKVLPYDLIKMTSIFRRLFSRYGWPKIILSSLWQTAKCLYPPGYKRRLPKSGRRPSNSLFVFIDSESSDLVDIAEVAHIAKIIFAALVGFTNAYQRGSTQAWIAAQKLRQSGRNAPSNGYLTPAWLTNKTMELIDSFNDEAAYSLIKRVCTGLAYRNHMLRCGEERNTQEATSVAPAEHNIFDPIIRGLKHESTLSFKTPTEKGKKGFSYFTVPENVEHRQASPLPDSSLECIIEWLRSVIISEWNGKDDILNGTAMYGALELMSSIYKFYAGRDLSPDLFETPYIFDRLNALETPLTWIEAKHRGSSHLLDYPFLFTPSRLVCYFRAINFASMSKAFRETKANAALRSRLDFSTDPWAKGARGTLRQSHRLNKLTNPHLVLDIKRGHILKDAFDQLWRRQKRELLRPLKVRLGQDYSEEGSDHGGVQQEFVRIAVAEAMDPKYGAFTTDPVTHMSWFQPESLEPLYKFELLGLLVSLAIYNGLILPFSFPIALYMKLLNHEPDRIEDIVDGWPDLARGLRALRDWSDGDVEDVFCRTYTFSCDVFGVRKDADLLPPDPEGITSADSSHMVTNANRESYIRDYIRQLTSHSVARQYEAFAKGFKAVINPKSLNLFTPVALQTLVQGISHIDTHALEAIARYDAGFTPNDPLIKDFWSIVHSWASPPSAVETSTTPWSVPQDDRNAQEAGQAKIRGLLEFVTASDRLPAGGESRVTFLIQKNGSGDERLPTSMTCFGHLLLPEYSSREILEEKLLKAVENAKGFGQP